MSKTQPPIVQEAKHYLMCVLNLSEPAAYHAVRRRAMSTETTMAVVAEHVLAVEPQGLSEAIRARSSKSGKSGVDG